MTNMTQSMTDHIIFPTNFSDACHAAIPAVTRWIDAHDARLSLVHIYNPKKTLHREAEALLHSFYAEADNYRDCSRHLIAGEAFDGITSFCKGQQGALLFMPPSDRTGLARPFHVSTRARLLRALHLPVWTMGQATLNTGAAVAGRNIAVWVQDCRKDQGSLLAAAAHAERHNARLHILYLIPETDEGTMVSAMYSKTPLGTETASDDLNELSASLPPALRYQIHVQMGDIQREFHAFLRASEAELLIVNRRMALQKSLLRPAIHPIFQGCKIPIICLPDGMQIAAGGETTPAPADALPKKRVPIYSTSTFIAQR